MSPGPIDFFIIVMRRHAGYEAFTQKCWLIILLKHFYTHVVMDRVKVGYNIPI